MCDTEVNKGKSIMVYKFKNYFSEKETSANWIIENVRIKFLTYFKHQINIIVLIFVL